MGLFSRIRENRRLRDHEDRIETLEGKYRALNADQTTLWDKVTVALGRIAKRASIIEKAQQEEEADGDNPLSPEASLLEDDGLPFLTPRQREIQAAILASRRRQ